MGEIGSQKSASGPLLGHLADSVIVSTIFSSQNYCLTVAAEASGIGLPVIADIRNRFAFVLASVHWHLLICKVRDVKSQRMHLRDLDERYEVIRNLVTWQQRPKTQKNGLFDPSFVSRPVSQANL